MPSLLSPDRLRAASLRPRQSIEPRELVALAGRILQPSGALIRPRQGEVQAGALRCERDPELQFLDRTIDVAGVEQRLAERLVRREGFGCRRHRLLRPWQ